MKIIILVLVVLGLVGLIAGGGYLYKKSYEEKYAITLESSICNIAEYGTKKEMEKMLPKNKNIPLEKLLNIAISNGNKEIIDFLISKGAKTDSLPAAIALGKKDEVEKYLKQGKVSEKIEYWCSDNPRKIMETYSKTNIISNLYIAAVNNQIEIVKLLLENGESVEDGFESHFGISSQIASFHDSCFTTALDVAVEKGKKEIVQLLLEKGADVNFEDSGKTALDFAKDEEIKQLLLKYGAKKGTPVEPRFYM